MRKLQELNKLLTDIDKRIKAVSKELEMLPKGSLNMENRRGKQVHVYTRWEDGRRTRISIEKDVDMQACLVKATILTKELKCLEHNRKLIERLLADYMPYSYGQAIREVEQASHCNAVKLMQLYSQKYDKLSLWERNYKPSNYMANERVHYTTKGLCVRSKSEVLIAEKLYEYHIAFRYEEPLTIGGIEYYPDFTIMREDGKMFYWEHAGLTNSAKYLSRLTSKINLYATAGIVPWDNLIITFDNATGNIDLRIVESEIRNKLLL